MALMALFLLFLSASTAAARLQSACSITILILPSSGSPPAPLEEEGADTGAGEDIGAGDLATDYIGIPSDDHTYSE